MSRKDTLRALLGARQEQLPGGNSEELGQSSSVTEPKPLVRSGAVAAMGRSLNDIVNAADEARALVAAGEAVVEIPPERIEPSFVTDRLPGSGTSDEALVALIRENGQQVPILVRPHPSRPHFYQVAYGHRRLRALTALGRPVRAVVRNLSDAELVVAQGQENSARTDLSYIERALFATALEDRGFDRPLIMAALNVEKTQLSRLLAIARTLPHEIVAAIGPAPKAGRPRWMALAERLSRKDSQDIITRVLERPEFEAADSDTRFARIFEALGQKKNPPVRSTPWRDENGRKVAKIERGDRGFALIVDEKVAPTFGDYLLERLPEIYRSFRQERGGTS